MKKQSDTIAMRHNKELERQVLGAIINDASVLPQIRDLVSADCFYNNDNRKVWDVIEELEHDGKPYDMMSLFRYGLEHGGEELKPAVLADITSSAIHTHLFESADLLRKLMLQRRMVEFGMKAIQFGSEPINDDIDVMIDSLKRRMDCIMESGDNGIFNLEMVQRNLLSKIVKMRNENLEETGTHTGFSFFDDFGGLHPSDLIVIAGETSFGKTAFANAMALNASNTGHRICYYSMEMSNEQMASRFISMAENISGAKMLYTPSKLTEYEVNLIGQTILSNNGKNIFLFDRSQNNIKNILLGIRTMKAKHDIHGAIIDYIGMVKGDKDSRQSEASMLNDIARDLKNIAKELGIWVIAISQMSRDDDNKESHLPNINKLKGSGGIAEAADDVVLVYRPEHRYPKEQFPEPYKDVPTKGKALIIVAKKRNGATGNFMCNFNGARTLFTEDMENRHRQVTFKDDPIRMVKSENKSNLPF